LLELIRYIHLNPLRAKVVEDLKALDKYPWTGHSVLLGNNENPLVPEMPPVIEEDKFLSEKTVEDVLRHFGENLKEARQKYRQFVEKGIKKGKRPELQGGGLIRSAGGDTSVLSCSRSEDREIADQRILGSGDFVAKVLRNINEEEPTKLKKLPLQVLSLKVADHFKITEEELRSPIKKRGATEAKAIFSYLAIKDMGYSGREVGHFLNMRSYSAIRRSEKGKEIFDKKRISRDLFYE